ncbi:GNAT family N-acetyltransferase [Roseisolibacter agri]|uniref:GNAT family N-acetyltransferase n=1 Tax=Roseisolibacter agri TaxID=2014610 RepID=UPI0024E041DB|nr:GNAT family N-acetyltransferase [Roseisolibacter agri]
MTHSAWAPARTPGMRVLADDALVLVDSGLACDTFNHVCRARLDGTDAVTRVRAAVAHFRDAGRPFSWWVRPEDRPQALGALLEAEGLAAAESEVVMACDDLAALAEVAVPGGLTIVRARDARTLADFATVNAENWSPPDAHVVRFYERAASALLADGSPQRFHVAYLDGVPVATAEVTLAGGSAGVFNVATRTAFRRRGIGGAVTAHALRDAHVAGARRGVLEASADGAGVYARLGFRAMGMVTEYKPA